MASKSNKRLTTTEFIEKAKLVHGDRYDYTNTIYVNSHTKVEISCKTHGSFWQAATTHLSNHGCAKCRDIELADNKRSNIQEFIGKAMSVHGGRYDYSRSIYINANTKVEIICPDHGSFMQTPNKHLMAIFGCPKCYREQQGIRQSRSSNEFIGKSVAVHGDKYDYSQSVYSGINKYVDIICKTHGVFRQMASNHLNGAGCAKCGFDATAKAKTKSHNEFIAECISAHMGKYDYSKTIYDGIFNRITVVCQEHGEFSVIAASHRSGTGCPECSKVKSKLEQRIELILDGCNITYEREKTFATLKHKGRLRFDFYIPSIGLFIEAQGAQHTKAVKYFGGESGLVDRLTRDNLKREFVRNFPDHTLMEVWFDDKYIENTVIQGVDAARQRMKDKPMNPTLFTL